MRTVNLYKDDVGRGSLILVNLNHPIKSSMKIPLMPVDAEYKDICMETKASTLLSRLLDTIGSKGKIIPVSGYRSKEEQEQIYEESLKENGMEFTRKYVALPDRSEHQTGLAIDLSEKSETIDFIRPDFPYTGICGEFRQKAARYGFIERYAKGKERTTGISHEPWHFRYVGYPHSQIIKNYHMSLEEYIEHMKEFPYEGKHYFLKEKSRMTEVFYVRKDSHKTTIDLPDNDLYQISGNNVDGFIVTLWRQ